MGNRIGRIGGRGKKSPKIKRVPKMSRIDAAIVEITDFLTEAESADVSTAIRRAAIADVPSLAAETGKVYFPFLALAERLARRRRRVTHPEIKAVLDECGVSREVVRIGGYRAKLFVADENSLRALRRRIVAMG